VFWMDAKVSAHSRERAYRCRGHERDGVPPWRAGRHLGQRHGKMRGAWDAKDAWARADSTDGLPRSPGSLERIVLPDVLLTGAVVRRVMNASGVH